MQDRTFYLRNILNGVFILLALGAMVGVLVCRSRLGVNISYGVGLLAVVIKIIEVILRMPAMTNTTVYEQRRRQRRHASDTPSTEKTEE